MFLLKKADLAIRSMLRILITTIRPLLGPSGICPFSLGCTQYADLQLKTEPLHIALFNICHRLLLCNPISGFFRKS